jgi:5,5'-dehydrodivanillate O-demethylase
MSVISLEKHNGESPHVPIDLFEEVARTGPGTLAGRYMRQFWIPVGVSHQLAPGKAKPITVMSEKFTLFRGTEGVAHVLPFNCPHRGTQLSVGYVKEDSISCLYHGWEFAGSGQCVAMPGERAGLADTLKIKNYPTREHIGLIYAYLGEGEPPAFPPYPAFEGDGLIEIDCEVFDNNYFQSWENDWDIYHANFTHRTGQLHGMDFDRWIATEEFEETDFGVVRSGETGMGTFHSTLLMPTTVRLVIPTLNEQSRRSGPQLRRTYITHVPLDDMRDIAYVSMHVPVYGAQAQAEYLASRKEVQRIRAQAPSPQSVAAKIRAGEASILDYKDHPALVIIEDLCAQGGQGVVADRRAERLGRTDRGVVYLRRLWERELQALADGRPTKRWTTPDALPDPHVVH